MFTLEQVLVQLRARIDRKYGGQAEAARQLGVTRSWLSQVLAGKRPPSKNLLAEINLEAVRMYRARRPS